MEIVIFSKFLRHHDIQSKMAIPIAALDHFNIPEGDNKVNLHPKDSDGKEWRFRCYNRQYGCPVLTTGWLAFVEAKRLQVGDEVTFSKLEDEDEDEAGPQYRIRATRVITLFGKQHVVDLPHP